MLLREPLIRILQPRIFSFFNSGWGINYLKRVSTPGTWTIKPTWSQ